jgi:hypothetical protein
MAALRVLVGQGGVGQGVSSEPPILARVGGLGIMLRQLVLAGLAFVLLPFQHNLLRKHVDMSTRWSYSYCSLILVFWFFAKHDLLLFCAHFSYVMFCFDVLILI